MSGTKPTAVQQTTSKNGVQADDSHGFRARMSQTKTNESKKEENKMAFFNSAVGVLQTLVVALGAGLGIWGAINLLEGYGNDNPGAKSQGMKQLMAGGGVALIGITLVPQLAGLFG
jgi:hypothetical protein